MTTEELEDRLAALMQEATDGGLDREDLLDALSLQRQILIDLEEEGD